MNPLLEEVLSLIRELGSLSEDQRVRFLNVAGKLDETQLTQLKTTLLKVRTEEMEKMKSQIETLSKVGAAFEEWKADKARAHLHASESPSAQEDAVSAESLLSKL